MNYLKNLLIQLFENQHRRYLLLFVFLYTLYYVPTFLGKALEPILFAAISKETEKSGLSIQHASQSFHFPRSLEYRNVRIQLLDRPGLPIILDTLRFRIDSFYPLKVSSLIEAYQGVFVCNSNSSNDNFSLPIDFQCSLKGLSLESYAPLFALGIKGILEGPITGAFSIKPEETNIHMSLGLTNASFDIAKTPLSAFVKIPPMKQIEAQIKTHLSHRTLNLEPSNLSSSYGSIFNAQGTIELSETGNPINTQINGRLELNPEGVQKLGPWLELITPGVKIDSRPSQFNLNQTNSQQAILRISN